MVIRWTSKKLFNRRTIMRGMYAAAVIVGLIANSVAPRTAHAIGCFSGGAAGAVAGHLAHHGIIGAIGGCIAGHEMNKHQKQQREMQMQQQNVYHR